MPLPRPQTLQKLKVPIIDPELCKSLYWRGAGQEAITEDMLCAGYLEGKRDACLVSATLCLPHLGNHPPLFMPPFSESPGDILSHLSLAGSPLACLDFFLFIHGLCTEHFSSKTWVGSCYSGEGPVVQNPDLKG